MEPEIIYLTAAQVRQRYGGRSDMWLYRLLNSDSKFPQPMRVRGRRYWKCADLEAWEKSTADEVAPC